MLEVTDETFPAFTRHPLSVLSFTSPWCTVCKKVSSHLEVLADTFNDRVAFGKCDITTSPQTPAQLQVMSIPTVIIFKDGNEVKRIGGAASENELSEAIKEYL